MSQESLQNSIFSFEINTLGTISGQNYQGKFIYQRPTIGKKRDIFKEEAILNSEYQDNLNLEILSINAAVAFLKVTLIECPQWFKDKKYGLDLEDENIFEEISNKIKDFEDKRSKKIEEILNQKLEPKKEEKVE